MSKFNNFLPEKCPILRLWCCQHQPTELFSAKILWETGFSLCFCNFK